MINVALIGAGGIGSRHLQGLTNIDRKINIIVIDPNVKSLENAKLLYNQKAINRNIISIHYNESLDDIKNDIDVCIVATKSDVRRAVIESLLSKVNVSYLLLEKFLFQSEDDFFIAAELFKSTDTKVWVNCARRIYPFYKKNKKVFIFRKD